MRMKACMFLLLNLLILRHASASITSFSSQAAFDAATSGMTTINFGTAAPPPSGGTTVYPTGLTLSGVTFTSPAGGTLATISQTYCCPTYARGYDTLDGYPAGIDVALPSGETAFGFLLFTVDLGNLNGTNQDKVDVTLGGKTFTVTTATAPTAIFVGFVSTSSISTISIIPETSTDVGTDIMNVAFGNGVPSNTMPEPATVWLLAGSLLSIPFLTTARRSRTRPRGKTRATR
jgi:hypothetical protein